MRSDAWKEGRSESARINGRKKLVDLAERAIGIEAAERAVIEAGIKIAHAWRLAIQQGVNGLDDINAAAQVLADAVAELEELTR